MGQSASLRNDPVGAFQPLTRPDFMHAPHLVWPAMAALAATWLVMLLLGAGTLDAAVLLALYAAERPSQALVAMGFTFLGNGTTLLPISAIAALWLVYRKRRRPAAILLASTISGRLMIVGEKLLFARARPDEQMRLVDISSLSFPSGHAGNSMMVFLGIALLGFEDPGRRRAAVAVALTLTALVGLSRPMLGVHWPSDVIAGWSFGALWILLWMRFSANLLAREGNPRVSTVQ